ncbi:MAG: Nif3-like dinuclear metal center hexameric protein [Ignavibacteriaceae bacterium]
MHFKHRSAFFFDMTGTEIIKYFENWAPKEIAWQKDNVGLQIGSMERKIKNILLSLELTNRVIDDAIKKNCNFIITHHPFLFHPLRKIDLHKDKNSKLIEKLIKNNITLYSAHTNLDSIKDGVSFELAKKLKLQNIDFLVRLKSNQFKLIIFVPENFVDEVAGAIFKSGGGIIGEYSNCSFRTSGKGTFKGSSKANPSLGKKETDEKVEEVKLEVLVDSWKINRVISAITKVHPYEEAAYDIIPLENYNVNYGMGAIGVLDQPVNAEEFLNFVAQKLKIKNFRYVQGKKNRIQKVAVCGGSGSEYIDDAIKNNADAFITADLKYHTFQDYQDEILLIDAGHYETEIFSLDEVKRKLLGFIDDSSIKVFKYSGSTNPIIFYNN